MERLCFFNGSFGMHEYCITCERRTNRTVSLFEGPKGFKEIFEIELKYDWNKEDFSLIQKCILKEFNSEVHIQSILEAILALKDKYAFSINEIESIDVTTFLTCYHIAGNGAYRDRTKVHSKEQADHSLPYLIAVAIFDNEVYPEQFLPDRIEKNDVQDLLQKVSVHTALPFHKPVKVAGLLDPYTSKYPDKVPCKVEIKLKDGKKFEEEREDYHGFFTRPMNWDDVEKKFAKLTDGIVPEEKQQQITELIANLEKREMKEFITLLNKYADK